MTNVNAQALHGAVLALQFRLKARDFIDPEVSLSVSTKDWRKTCIEVSFKVRDDSQYTYKSFYGEDAALIKDKGIDEHFINPLTDMMKRLASNALEHHA